MSRLPRLVTTTLLLPLAVAACAVAPPTGPTVMALPKPGGNFADFQNQDAACRNFASAQIGYGSPAQAANQSAVGSAALGTAIGAAAGAALGSVSGNAGAGAAIGGAGGLLVGSAAGANNAQLSGAALQNRYDVAYTQCMVAAGYTVEQPSYAVPAYAYGPSPYAYPPPYYYGPSVGIGIGGGWGPRWHRW
jgi:outer membrane lipoprotein SlyB